MRADAQVSEAIFRNALAPGAWDALRPSERNRLRGRWARQLRGHDAATLRGFADAPVPRLASDARLDLQLVDPERRIEDPEELDSFIRFCNVHERLACHGVDAKGIHILTPFETFRRHGVVLGISGMGKSTYMARTFCQLSLQDGPMVLVDQEKILLEEVLTHLPEHRLKDVLIIDPSDLERSWGVNLVQFEREFVDEADPNYTSKIEYLNDRLASEITGSLAVLQLDTAGYSPGPYVRDALNNLFLAAVESESTSMVDVYTLLTVPGIRDSVATHVLRDSVRNWLQYDMSAYDHTKIDAVRNKLHPFLRRVMINTFSRRDPCISIGQMIAQNKIVVLDLDSTKLSKPISRLIGYMFLILLRLTLEHRYSKAVEENRLDQLSEFHLMVDEFRNFASSSTVDLFAEGRKRKVSVVVGLQSLDQVPDEVANSLYNVSTWTAFNCGPEDAARVCRLFGFTNNLGNPLLEEVTGLPKYVAKLRYEAERHIDGAQPFGFEYVTLHAYPAMRPHRYARRLLQQLRACSRRDHYKPNTEEDTRTVYEENDQTNNDVLRAVWDARLAVRHPDTYYLAGKEYLAREGAVGGYVAQSLIHAVLEARGIILTKQRLAQILRHLRAHRLSVTDALPSGFKTTRLTREGYHALELLITPGSSSNEGGVPHRKAVQGAFIALSGLGALRLTLPQQTTDEYVPDLLLEDPPPPVRKALGLPEQAKSAHIQVEVATARHPDRMAANVLNAVKAGAHPILVLPSPEHAAKVALSLANVGGHGARLVLEDTQRRHHRIWTGLVIDEGKGLHIVAVPRIQLGAGDAPPTHDDAPLQAAIGEYLALVSGPFRLDSLRQHLRQKGFDLKPRQLRPILEGTFGLRALDTAGKRYATP